MSAGALVTGAGRGLGLEIARALADRGLAVHVTDVDPEAAERAAHEIGRGAHASALDVRDAEACRAAAAATPSLELWVNNAGLLVTGPAWEQSEETRRLMLGVNALGTINGTLAALEPMRVAGRGHVINVVSLAGIVAAPGEAVYGASKHAAIAFSLGTLYDLRKSGVKGIDLSCVCPDGIWTPMLHDKLDDPEAAASFSGVLLQPRDVARSVAGLVDKPRPVTILPRRRGPLIRAIDLWPRLGEKVIGPALAAGRLKQWRLRRRPPSS